MERYCLLRISRFVPAKTSLKSRRVHRKCLSQNIFRDNKKIFCDFSLGMELGNENSETHYNFCMKLASFSVLENKQVQRSFFSVLFMPYNKSNYIKFNYIADIVHYVSYIVKLSFGSTPNPSEY